MKNVTLVLILAGSIVLSQDAEGVPLRHRRQANTAQNEAMDSPPAAAAGSSVDPDQNSGILRQRQPFSIIGYSEDFKRGYVNPGTETLKQRLRGVDFNDSPAVAPLNDPTSPLIEKPLIWVIPYVKSDRQGKSADVAESALPDSNTNASNADAEDSTVTPPTIPNATSDIGINDLEGVSTDKSTSE